MKRIAIIADQALAARLFLRTPILDILRARQDNFINIYTPARRLKKEIGFKNVRVRGCRFYFGLKDSDVIVLPDWHNKASKEILQRAAGWGIPTVFVQAGPAQPSAGYQTDLYPSRLCVWGELARQMYIKRGIDPARIVVTGSPRFDLYHGFKAKRLFGSDKKVLLFATQAIWQSPEHHGGSREVIARQLDVMQTACQRLNVQLVCKLHPSDDPALYKREGVIVIEDAAVRKANYIRGYCSTGYDPSADDLKNFGEIVSSCDVATTLFSTAGLEAMILGKPVIFFDTAGYYKMFEANRLFIERCAFALAEDNDRFIALFERYLNDAAADADRQKQAVFDCAFKQDGEASQRVADVINAALDKG
jgi:hypothetical protein